MTLTVDGRERTAYAELDKDADEVAAVFNTLLNRYAASAPPCWD